MKSAGYGSPVEWHQDWAFYPHTNDDVLATGIYLDDCDMDNGPLLVLPGTHHGPTWDHHAEGRFCGAMNPAACDLDFSKAVPLMGPAGSMTIHHVRRCMARRSTAPTASAACCCTNTPPPTPSRCSASRTSTSSTAAWWWASRPSSRASAGPVRLPLPPADHQGSIYENQRSTARRFFDTFEDARVG